MMQKINEKGQFARLDPKAYLYANILVLGENECWEWQGGKNQQGYGEFRNRHLGEAMGFKKATAASRASYFIHNGPLLPSEWVLHKCDNPACCNPKHLYIGTPKQNVQDMVDRGRISRGEGRPASKLKDIDVKEMRRIKATTKISYKKLGEIYGVGPSCAHRAVTGEGWRHVA